MALIKEFRSDMQKNELVLVFAKEGEVPEYYEKMVRYNDIQGVMRFRLDMNDGVRRYVYDADGMRPLVMAYEDRKPGFEELKNILYDVMDAIEGCREYLIDEDDFVVSDECIFLDDYGNASVPCLPGYGKPLKSQFSSLFEYFMDRIDYKDKAAVVALYDIYRKSREHGFNFEYIRKTLGKREKPQRSGNPADDLSVEIQEILPQKEQEQPALKESAGLPDRTDAEEKDIKEDYGRKNPSQKKKKWPLLTFGQRRDETRLLYSIDKLCSLTSKDGKENINVGSLPFVIGKGDQSHNPDYCLAYPQISRVHARLSRSGDGSICIEDMRSLNGTYVNGEELQPGKPRKLGFGDTVSFANMQFVFET